MQGKFAALSFSFLLVAPASAQERAEPARVDPSSRSWLTNDDYPAQALFKGEQGDASIAFDITEQGRVENCHTVTSSGSKALDDASCAILLKRGRFQPATDDKGQAVRSTKTKTFRWRLPRAR